MAKKPTQSKPPLTPPKPTELPDRSWVYAFRKEGKYPEPTPRNGKWLIFTPIEEVDAVWETIRAATEKGLLGNRSRASTGKKKAAFAKEPDSRVVEVYTYDAADKADVMRIRQKLKDLGFVQELHYKSEADTMAGNYSANVGRRVDQYSA